MATLNQPQNFNLLSSLGFKFLLHRAPNVNFFCTAANLPSLSLGEASLYTPFTNIPVYGDKLEFGDFSLQFKLDEDFANYFEIYNWMVGLGFPKAFEQHKKLTSAPAGSTDRLTSDATLTILTSAKNSNIEIVFEDLWPTTLAAVEFDLERENVEYVTALVSFRFKYFDIRVKDK